MISGLDGRSGEAATASSSASQTTPRPSSILARRRLHGGNFFSPSSPREADLPAQRSASEAQARLPRPYVDARGAGDPETAAGARAQAPLRVAGWRVSTPVERRHRLSRSKDFDAVYRQGRSVSTRFLVLHWFSREEGDDEPRLGLAVPRAVGTAVVRNKMKRRLRELWRARLEELPRGRDYVLVVRPGLPEAAESRGFDWLGERVDEVLSKAGSA
jgi:ribonuclease P protein component